MHYSEAGGALRDLAESKHRRIPSPWIELELIEVDTDGDTDNRRVNLETLTTEINVDRQVTVLLYGSSGSGKTTVLDQLEVRLLRQNVAVLRLDSSLIRDIVIGNAIDIVDFVKRNGPASFPAKIWKSRAKHAKVVVLIDSLNEMNLEFLGDRRWNLIRNLISGNHAYPVVATTRLQAGSDEIRRPVRRLVIQELNAPQIHDYIVKRGLNAEVVQEQMRSMDLTEACRSPLMISAFCDFVGSGRKIEGEMLSRAQLMRSAGLGRVTAGQIPPKIRQLIARGANLSHVWASAAACARFSDTREFRYSSVAKLLNDDSGSHFAEPIIDLFLELGPIERLQYPPTDEPRYRMAHDRYIDVGLALGWGTEEPPEIAYQTARFGGFIADWCALQQNPVQSIRKVLEVSSRNLRFDVMADLLAADGPLLDAQLRAEIWRSLAHGFTLPQKKRMELVDALSTLSKSLIREGLAHDLLYPLSVDMPTVVSRVEEALLAGRLDGDGFRRLCRRATRRSWADRARLRGSNDSTGPEFGEPDVDDAAGRSLIEGDVSAPSDKSADVHPLMEVPIDDKGQAARESGELADSRTEDLIRCLFDSEKVIRKAAALELRRRTSEPAVATLSDRLGELQGDDRFRLISALGRVGLTTYLPVLAAELSNSDPLVRRAIVKALSRLGSAPGRELVRGAASDENPGVRAQVCLALGRTGDLDDLPQLEALAGDNELEVRYRAIGALGRLLNFRGKRDTLPPFADSLVNGVRNALSGMPETTLAQFCKMLETMAVPDRVCILKDLSRHPLAKVRGAALTAMMTVDASEALHAAVAMLSDEPDGINRSAAVKVIGQSQAVEHADLVRRVLSDPAQEARGSAAQALATMNDVGSAQQIAGLLADRVAEVRGSACTALGFLGIREAIPELIGMLEDRASNVRGSAAKALGYLGACDAVSQLCGCLSDPVPRVRGTSAVALGMIGDVVAVPALLRLVADPVGDVRRGAIVALGFLGDPEAVPAVLGVADDPDASVRWTAANSLGHLGDTSTIPTLVRLLEDTDAHVRGASATALGRLRDPAVVAELSRLAADQDAHVRGSVATALGRIGGSKGLRVLKDLSGDNDNVVRSAAITALGRTGAGSSTAIINAALGDRAYQVRGAAVRAVAQADPDRDISGFLTDPSGVVRRSALAGVLSARRAGLTGASLAMAADAEDETRALVATALSGMSSDAAVENLGRLLDDESPAVAASAAESLARLPDEAGVSVLIEGVASTRTATRCAAAETLGRYGVEAALGELQQMLVSAEPVCRMIAAKALGQIGHPSSCGALVAALLSDSDNYVRGTAATALGRVGAGHSDARTALIGALNDPHPPVVGLAAQALGVLGGDEARGALESCVRRENLSLWSRATAVRALGPLCRRPQLWLLELADEYKARPAESSGAKFRGTIIDIVSRGAWDDQVQRWLTNVVLLDPDPINQTAAATGLAAHSAMPIEVARRVATERDRTGRESRRADVVGVVIQAAIRSAAVASPDLASLAQLLAELMNRSRSTMIANSALSALPLLGLEPATHFLESLRAGLAVETVGVFDSILRSQQAQLEVRRSELAAYNNLAQSPELFVRAFTPHTLPEVETMKKPSCTIGIVTIIGEEFRAVSEWLLSHNPEGRTIVDGSRYVYEATIPTGAGSVRFVATQALDQGVSSAANAQAFLVKRFSPKLTVLLGIAGGIHGDVSLGDVVIASQIINYGPAADTPTGIRHRGISFVSPKPVVVALNEFFAQRGEPLELMAYPDGIFTDKRVFNLQRGPIGTGQYVVKSRKSETRAFLKNYHEKTLALETEADAVSRYFVEEGSDEGLAGYLVIRAISDHADEAKDDRWKLQASRNAVIALQEILPPIVELMTAH